MAECKRPNVLELAATEDASRRLVERASRAQREDPKCPAAQVAAQEQRVVGMRAPVPGMATVLVKDLGIDEVIVRARLLLGGVGPCMRVV